MSGGGGARSDTCTLLDKVPMVEYGAWRPIKVGEVEAGVRKISLLLNQHWQLIS